MEGKTSTDIAFDAIVQSVKTLVDGGLRVSFDLSESATDAAKFLMDCKRNEHPLTIAVVVRKVDPFDALFNIGAT